MQPPLRRPGIPVVNQHTHPGSAQVKSHNAAPLFLLQDKSGRNGSVPQINTSLYASPFLDIQVSLQTHSSPIERYFISAQDAAPTAVYLIPDNAARQPHGPRAVHAFAQENPPLYVRLAGIYSHTVRLLEPCVPAIKVAPKAGPPQRHRTRGVESVMQSNSAPDPRLVNPQRRTVITAEIPALACENASDLAARKTCPSMAAKAALAEHISPHGCALHAEGRLSPVESPAGTINIALDQSALQAHAVNRMEAFSQN